MALLASFPWLDRLLRDAGRPDLALLAPFSAAPTLAAVLASTVGLVLALRRPAQPVGWLPLAMWPTAWSSAPGRCRLPPRSRGCIPP